MSKHSFKLCVWGSAIGVSRKTSITLLGSISDIQIWISPSSCINPNSIHFPFFVLHLNYRLWAGSTSQLTCLCLGSCPHSSLLITNEPAPASIFLQHLPASPSTCLSSSSPLHIQALSFFLFYEPFLWQRANGGTHRLLSGWWGAEEEREETERLRRRREKNSYLTGSKENNGMERT